MIFATTPKKLHLTNSHAAEGQKKAFKPSEETQRHKIHITL